MFYQEQMDMDWSILEQIAAADVPMLSQSPEDDYIAEETKALVRNALKSLTPRDRQIIEQRFGFNDHDEMTLKNVGDALGLTRERIRQIEAKTLSNLRSDSKFLTIRDGSFQIPVRVPVRVPVKRPNFSKMWYEYLFRKEIAAKRKKAEAKAKAMAAAEAKAKSKAEAKAMAKAEAEARAEANALSKAIALAEKQRALQESRRLTAENKILWYEMDADTAEIEAVSLEKSAADHNSRPCESKLQQRKNNQFATADRTKARRLREKAARLRDRANNTREEWQIPIKQYIPREVVPRPAAKPIITPRPTPKTQTPKPKLKPRPKPKQKPRLETVYYKVPQANLDRPPTAKSRQQALAEQKNAADRDFRAKVEQLRYAQD